MRKLALAVLVLCFSSCATYRSLGYAPAGGEAKGPEIVQIKLKFTNGYLIKSKKPILIDPGAPWDFGRLSYALKENGVKPEELGLVILTHGHADHAGLGAFLQKAYRVKIAAGAGDVKMLESGKNDELKSQYFSASLIKPIVDVRFDPFTPDVAIKEPLDLKPYGLDAKVLPLPGHTPGSLVVLLSDRRAFVGDVILGGALGGIFWPESPGEHYYQADAAANFRNIRWLEKQGIETYYLGHGGPVKRTDVIEAFKDRGPSGTQVPTPPVFIKDKDAFMAFRSNAAHYWYWARSALSALSADPNHQPLLRSGVIMGDPHILNFGDVYLTKKPPIISANDLDDAATGPLLGDLVRFYASTLVAKSGVSRAELVSAYTRGLSGLAPETVPDDIKRALAQTEGDIVQARTRETMKNVATDAAGVMRFGEKAKLTPLSQATPEIAALYQSMHSPMVASLQNHEILDVGFKIPTSGGSRGKARFWYLVKSADGEVRIFEFKELGDSSVSYFSVQPGASARFHAARQAFWSDSSDPQTQDFQYRFVSNGTKNFWKRPRYKPLVDGEGVAPEAAKSLLLYEAGVLGRIHSAAGAADYAALFQDRKADVERVLEQLSQAYVSELLKANAATLQ